MSAQTSMAPNTNPATDKNVFRLRGQLSRLTGQVRTNPNPQPTIPRSEADAPAPSDDLERSLLTHEQPVPASEDHEPKDQKVSQCHDGPDSPGTSTASGTSDASARVSATVGEGHEDQEEEAALGCEEGSEAASESEVSTEPQEAAPVMTQGTATAQEEDGHDCSAGDTEEVSIELQRAMADEVYELKSEKFELLSAMRDYEIQAQEMSLRLRRYEGRGTSQSPTRSTVMTANAVLETRLYNFQEQLGESRIEMEEELQLVAGDKGLLQEELMEALNDKQQAVHELEQLRDALTQEVADKDAKLAQAKECVNDVKDVVEILAKQLHDNQMELAHERSLRDKSGPVEAALQQQLESAEAALEQAELQVRTLEQTNAELAQELQDTNAHSEKVAGQLEEQLDTEHANRRLRAEVEELKKELQSLAIANADAMSREAEMRTEMSSFQKREHELGVELEQLTSAVDQRIQAYQSRELELESQLAKLMQERDTAVKESASKHLSSMIGESSNELDRLKLMATWINTQKSDGGSGSSSQLGPKAHDFGNQALQESLLEKDVMHEALTKLRLEVAVLKADKEEAIAQADAIRGVLRQELDSLEGELQRALDERTKLARGGSSQRVLELEETVRRLEHDLELSVGTVATLDKALQKEQQLNQEAMAVHGHSSGVPAVMAVDGSVRALVHQLFGTMAAEVSSECVDEENLQKLLRELHDQVVQLQSAPATQAALKA